MDAQSDAQTKLAPTDVRAQIERILGSSDFHASERNRRFLGYVTDETLAGREVGIKAYTIACNVFGRSEDFDSGQDPIVRVEAGKLRKALERYYLTAGTTDAIRIEIPKGSYVPTFCPTALALEKPRSPQIAQGVPTIAVLPFALLGDDPAQSHFATGLSAEIAAALSHYQNVAVTCRYAAIGIESHTNLSNVREELGARFVLEGIVRRSLDRVRITVQLTDLEKRRQLWGETYDRTLSAENLFDVEDQVVRQVVEAVAGIYTGVITDAVWKESRRRRPTNLSAYEAVLHVHQHNQSPTLDLFIQAKAALEQAVRLEPEYVTAWASLGEIRCDEYTLGHGDDIELVREARRHAEKALGLDPKCEHAQFVVGLASLVLRDRASVVRVTEKLVAKPGCPSTLSWGGWLLALIGEWDRGLEVLEPQLEIQPGYPPWLHHAPFLHRYRRREYEAALESSLQFSMPELLWDPIDRAAVLGQLGRSSEAGKAVDEILGIQPKFADDPRRFLNCFIFTDDLVDHVLDGLMKAGFRG
jgi:adenylate cyclase